MAVLISELASSMNVSTAMCGRDCHAWGFVQNMENLNPTEIHCICIFYHFIYICCNARLLIPSCNIIIVQIIAL